MPELRRDPLLNRWVVIAPERARRPQQLLGLSHSRESVDQALDPFAEGNEGQTTPEIFALRPDDSAPNGPGWQLRVVPNRYPALQVEGEWQEPPAGGLFDAMPAIGAHEVLIETPRSDEQLTDLSVAQIDGIFSTIQLRMADLYRDRRIVQVLAFKNQGGEAGATLPHAHTQVVGLPVLSPTMRAQLQTSQMYWNEHGQSLQANIVEAEREAGKRVVYQDDLLIALCPFASGFPFEVSIYPAEHAADFRAASSAHVDTLASVLKTLLLKYQQLLGEVAYNFVLHSAPGGNSFTDVRSEFPDFAASYRWHLQLFPRITRQAGFEWGSGTHINIVPPEEAATALRSAQVAL